MHLKNLILFIFIMLTANTVTFAQKLSFQNVNDLNTLHKLNHIYDLIKHKSNGLLLADVRFDKGDLDGYLVLFDLSGNILKETRIGKPNSYERIVNISKYKDGFYLLMNSVLKTGEASILLYQLDDELSIVSNETIEIDEMNTASTMIYNPKENSLEIVVSVRDEAQNTFPRLIHYNLNDKSQSYIDFNSKNGPEKLEELEVYTTVIDENGKPTNHRMTKEELKEAGVDSQMIHVNKECTNIQFANDTYHEILLTGLENSKTLTDFWTAKVVDGKMIWEDRYPTEIGGDEGKATFKSEEGYIVFGHEYTKRKDTYYSYRMLLLNENGEEVDAKKFDTGKKDWFKDVVKVDEGIFFMFGQTQSITFPQTMSESEIINSSNLWTILVNEKGELIRDHLHETESIDEAYVATKLESGNILVAFSSNDVLKIGQFEVSKP